MGLFDTKKFCFCVDLKIGSLLIGAVMFIGIVTNLPGSSLQRLITMSIVACTWAVLLYGILSKRPNFMIPSVIVGIFGICVSIVLLIVIPIIGFFFLDDLQQYIDEQRKEFNEKVSVKNFLLLAWFSILVFTVWQWHVTSVIYSLRKSMINEKQRSTNATYPNLA